MEILVSNLQALSKRFNLFVLKDESFRQGLLSKWA